MLTTDIVFINNEPTCFIIKIDSSLTVNSISLCSNCVFQLSSGVSLSGNLIFIPSTISSVTFNTLGFNMQEGSSLNFNSAFDIVDGIFFNAQGNAIINTSINVSNSSFTPVNIIITSQFALSFQKNVNCKDCSIQTCGSGEVIFHNFKANLQPTITNCSSVFPLIIFKANISSFLPTETIGITIPSKYNGATINAMTSLFHSATVDVTSLTINGKIEVIAAATKATTFNVRGIIDGSGSIRAFDFFFFLGPFFINSTIFIDSNQFSSKGGHLTVKYIEFNADIFIGGFFEHSGNFSVERLELLSYGHLNINGSLNTRGTIISLGVIYVNGFLNISNGYLISSANFTSIGSLEFLGNVISNGTFYSHGQLSVSSFQFFSVGSLNISSLQIEFFYIINCSYLQMDGNLTMYEDKLLSDGSLSVNSCNYSINGIEGGIKLSGVINSRGILAISEESLISSGNFYSSSLTCSFGGKVKISESFFCSNGNLFISYNTFLSRGILNISSLEIKVYYNFISGSLYSNQYFNVAEDLFASNFRLNGNMHLTFGRIISKGILICDCNFTALANDVIISGILNSTYFILLDKFRSNFFDGPVWMNGALTLSILDEYFSFIGLLSAPSSTFLVTHLSTKLIINAPFYLEGALIRNATIFFITGKLQVNNTMFFSTINEESEYPYVYDFFETALFLSNITISGSGTFITRGYFIMQTIGNILFDIAVNFTCAISQKFCIQVVLGGNENNLIHFNSPVTVGTSVGVGLFQTAFLFSSNLFVNHSIIATLNSTINSTSNNGIVFQSSILMPILRERSPFLVLTTKKLSWYDNSGISNNVFLSSSSSSSSNSSNPSSLNIIVSPTFDLISTNLNNIILINSTFSVNDPNIEFQSVGRHYLTIKRGKFSYSISLNACDANNNNNIRSSSCSCNGISAPLGAYQCIDGVWQDNSAMSLPVLVNNTLVEDKVRLNNIFIVPSNHLLTINLGNNLVNHLIQSNSSLIQVHSTAFLQGNLTINFKEILSINSTEKKNNFTITLLSYNDTNGTSFNPIKFVSSSCQVVNAKEIKEAKTISISFNIDSSNCTFFSRGAIIGITIGVIAAASIITASLVIIAKKIAKQRAIKFSKEY